MTKGYPGGVTVLMSTCATDSPAQLAEALTSSANQTIAADELQLVVDGPLTDELEDLVAKAGCSGWSVIRIPLNRGLAAALNEGLRHARTTWVARMDADDIMLSHRLETQCEFVRSEAVDVCGAWIAEYDEFMVRQLAVKRLPLHHDDIARFALRRNPVAHMTAVFRLPTVLAAGGYPEHLRKFQDQALWGVLLARGAKFGNVPEVLVNVRTGRDFIRRRRGRQYLLAELKMMSHLRRVGAWSWPRWALNAAVRVPARLAPPFVTSVLYQRLRADAGRSQLEGSAK